MLAFWAFWEWVVVFFCSRNYLIWKEEDTLHTIQGCTVCKKIELCSIKPEFSPSQFDAPLRVHLSSFLAFVCLALCATFYFLFAQICFIWDLESLEKSSSQMSYEKQSWAKSTLCAVAWLSLLRHVHTVHTYRFWDRKAGHGGQ